MWPGVKIFYWPQNVELVLKLMRGKYTSKIDHLDHIANITPSMKHSSYSMLGVKSLSATKWPTGTETDEKGTQYWCSAERCRTNIKWESRKSNEQITYCHWSQWSDHRYWVSLANCTLFDLFWIVCCLVFYFVGGLADLRVLRRPMYWPDGLWSNKWVQSAPCCLVYSPSIWQTHPELGTLVWYLIDSN